MTEPFRAYAMIALNAPGGDYFQVKVPGAPVTGDRWVHVSCGLHAVAAGTPITPLPDDPVEPVPGRRSRLTNLLALSWQPAFCETEAGQDRVPRSSTLASCRSPRPQLSLHGLWPQPQGGTTAASRPASSRSTRPSQWTDLPAVEIDADTREPPRRRHAGDRELPRAPRVAQARHLLLDAGGADAYFDDTLRLVDAINASPVAALLADHVGAELDTADLRAAFDAAFGAGAGERVQVHCTGDGGRTLIQELSIGLAGAIAPGRRAGRLMRAADPVSPAAPAASSTPPGCNSRPGLALGRLRPEDVFSRQEALALSSLV